MKGIILPALAFAAASSAIGSPQAADKMTTSDIESIHVQGFMLGEEMSSVIEKIETERDYWVSSTANHDGFYAELVLKEEKLYLSRLWIDADETFDHGRQPIPLANVDDGGLLFALWFTGELEHYYGAKGAWGIRSHVRIFKFTDGVLDSVRSERTGLTVDKSKSALIRHSLRPPSAPTRKIEGKYRAPSIVVPALPEIELPDTPDDFDSHELPYAQPFELSPHPTSAKSEQGADQSTTDVDSKAEGKEGQIRESKKRSR